MKKIGLIILCILGLGLIVYGAGFLLLSLTSCDNGDNDAEEQIIKEPIEENVLVVQDEDMNSNNAINLKIGDGVYEVALEDNTATKALLEKLKEWNVIVNANEYGGFEKVGDLGFSLPREDKQITTEAGDLVLYNGNQISLFYDNNSWSYTKLGKVMIDDESLKEILGDGDVTLTFSLLK